MIEGLIITKEKIIYNESGNILHGIKKDSDGFDGFGEAYFSSIKHNTVKAWKRHKNMTLNLLVPFGKVCFVVCEDEGNIHKFVLSSKNYFRLTVPPMIWFGFKGLSIKNSLILNIANICHDPKEVERCELIDINFNWNKIK